MRTEHTPGPWKTFGLEVGQSRRNVICTLYQQAGDCVSMGTEKTKANARLIAAAPELLEALQRLLKLWEEAIDRDQDYMGMADFARTALARATGEAGE